MFIRNANTSCAIVIWNVSRWFVRRFKQIEFGATLNRIDRKRENIWFIFDAVCKMKGEKRVWMINLHALAEKFHANNEHWSKHAKSCCCVNQWCKLSKQSNPYQFIREMVSHLLIFVWLCSFDSSPSHRNPNWNDGAMGYDRISATTTSVTSRR